MTNNEITRRFIENLEKERETMGLTQAQMADQLNMSLAAYKYMISGKSAKIPIYVAYQVYQATGKFFFELCGNIVPEMQVLIDYRSLSPERQQAVRTMIAIERELSMPKDTSDEDLVPLYTITGNMEDGMYYDATNVEYMDVSAYRQFYGNQITCAVKITSNHLHPVYHMGDILLVCQRPPRDGDTGIFVSRKTHRIYIRKFRQTEPGRMEPLTQYGEVITVDSHNKQEMNEWIKFGYVLTKVR